jgi:putative peptidoglycan lipid II flippase
MTLLSRVFGLLRDMVIARVFGSGVAADAFFVAFRIPNLFRRMFAEGAFAMAFVPVLNEYKEQRSPQALKALIDRVAGTLGGFLLLFTVAGMLAAPWVVRAFAAGFADVEGKLELTTALLQITFPYLLCVSLAAFAGGILNSFGRFAAAAFTPVLLNLCMIAAALWLAPYCAEPITALAWGVFVAGIAQLLFLLPSLRALGLLPRPRWGWRDTGVRKIMKLMVPVLFGSSAAQLNLLINTQLAATLVSGSVSWLYYADRLLEFPVGLFGVALGTVILPRLSQQHAQQSGQAFSATLDWALRWALLIALPATLALALLAKPLLITLFYYGAFSAHDVTMASRSLVALAPGVVGFLVIKVLAPGFYSRQDSKTPAQIGIATVLVNIICSLLLIGPLAHVGLALAAAIAALVNASLLLIFLWRRDIYRLTPQWRVFSLRLVCAAALMALGIDWLAGADDDWLNAAAVDRVTKLTGLVVAGVLLYGGALLASGLRPRHLRLAIDRS